MCWRVDSGDNSVQQQVEERRMTHLSSSNYTCCLVLRQPVGMFLRCISLPSLTSLLKVTIHVLTTAVYVKTHWQEVDIDDHLCGASVVSWKVASVEFVSWCSTHSYSYRCCFVKFCIKYLYHKGSSLGFTFYWWRHVSKIYPGRQRQQRRLLLLPLES